MDRSNQHGDRGLGQSSRMTPERSAILRGIEGHSVEHSAKQAIALRTARLILTPLCPLDEAEHARASGSSDDALRDTRAAELQWRHGFGPWAIRGVGDNSFLGVAELRFAGDGIEGIAPDEVEAGWWVRENRRNQRIATDAMRVAIGDLWTRAAGVANVTAYIAEGENEPSRRLATSLGFTMRSQGRGRFGEAMTVYELLRDAWDRRGG